VKFFPGSHTFSPENNHGDNNYDNLDSNVDPITGRTHTFHLASNENNLTVDAGMYTTSNSGSGANILGFVFNDTNANGFEDEFDHGVPNQTVNLLNGSGTTIQSIMTDSQGIYEFQHISPGNYRIKFVISDGYVFSPEHAAGTNSTNDSDPDQTTGTTDTVIITGNESIVHIDAGIHPNRGSIGDFVFNDTNHNGHQDVGESGIEGVAVNLLKEDNPTPFESTITDSSGHYMFTANTGTYYHLHFVLPSGFHFSPLNVGDENSDSDVDTGSGHTDDFFLYGDEHHTDIDAGMYAAPSIHIVKTATPSNPKPGESVIYTLAVTNHSTFAANDIQVSDDLDNANFNTNLIPTCISSISQITPFNGGTVESDSNAIHWNIGQLNSLETTHVSFQGVIRSDIDHTTSCRNTAVAGGSNTETVQGDAVISVPVIVDEAAISFDQHVVSETETIFNPGDSVQYQIDMSNSGTAELNGLHLQDVLPGALTTLHDVSVPLGASIDSIAISGASTDIHAQASYENTLIVSNINLGINSNAHVNYFTDLADSDHFPLRTYRLHQNADKTDSDFYPERIKTSHVSADQNTDTALNAPDDQAVTLGASGNITFEVSRPTGNGKLIVDGDGPDFCILELDSNDPDIDTERYTVEVSQNSSSSGFESVGRNNRNSNCFDLADADMTWARYVRIRDTSTNTILNNQGVDIDALCLLQIGGFVTNTAGLYNGTTLLGTSDAEILVNFTDAFENPLAPRDCRSKTAPTVAQSLPLPPPPAAIEPEVVIPQVPFVSLPTTGPGFLVLPIALGMSFLWNRRKSAKSKG